MQTLQKFSVILPVKIFLVLIGICAFFLHHYWTEIGVSEIWNTEKWSSMRSSFYRLIGRFSRANSSSFSPGRPFSAASAYSANIDPLPVTSGSNVSNTATDLNVHPPHRSSSSLLKTRPTNQDVHHHPSSQIQPVSSITYYRSIEQNDQIKTGRLFENVSTQKSSGDLDYVSVNNNTLRF